jgi:cation diffusion facilitator CzcD-associated flavoprotein CzcO
MIDFSALAGKRVVVVGVGASAMDNAATALESGASEVRLLARRPVMPCVNKLMGIGSYGLSAGFSALDDNWKWRISEYAMRQQTPAPRSSVLRVSRHGNSSFHFGQGIEQITLQGQELDIRTTAGASIQADFLILGTGFEVNLDTRPELNNIARNVARWRDRFEAPKGMEAADLYRHPYLNSDFSFREKTPNSAPWVGNIYCFNHAAALSMGKLSSDIPAISEGAQLLAKSISEAFYVEDIEHHWGLLENYEEPELFGDEWIGSEI